MRRQEPTTALDHSPSNPRSIEAALRQCPEVDDCAVLLRTRTTGETSLVAYVVPAGDFRPEQLQAALETQLGYSPSGLVFVPLDRLPMGPDGQWEASAVEQVPVVSPALAERWEEKLKSLPEIEDVAVVSLDRGEPLPPLHLSDLLIRKQASIPKGAPQPKPELKADPKAASSRPAISEAPSLQCGDTWPTTLLEVLRRAVKTHPQNGVIYQRADGSELVQNYPQLQEDAERVLAGLRRLGLRAGDKVIFQFHKNEDFIPALWGCLLGGIVPIPIAIAPTYEQLNSTISKVHNAWLMFDRPCILTGGEIAGDLRGMARLLPMEGLRVETIESLRAAAPDADWHAAEPGDLALLSLTSGSTGMPKGVILTHRNLLHMSAATIECNRFTDQDVTLNWMPLDHVGSISFMSFMAVCLGARQVHALTGTVLQNPFLWLDWIQRYRASISWAPNFAFGLLNEKASEIGERKWDLSSMRFLVSAGEAVVAKTARRFLRLFAAHGLAPDSIVPAFGMSETCSGISWSDSFSLSTSSDEDIFVDVGPPIPGVTFRIVDDAGRIVNEEEVGHLELRGPSVTSGYYENPKANAETFTPDGWFRTGDLGFLKNGRLTLTGRGKDVIIINGVNFFSHEIEAVVEELEGVEVSFTAACAVRAAESPEDALAIFFHTPLSEDEELRRLLQEVRGKVVRTIGINPSFLIPLEKKAVPKTEIGKIQRSKLREQFERGEFTALLKRIDLLSGNANTIPDWFFRKVWVRKESSAPAREIRSKTVLLLANETSLARLLCERVHAVDGVCVLVEQGAEFQKKDGTHYRVNPQDRDHYRQLLESLARDNLQPDEVVHAWTYEVPAAKAPGQDGDNVSAEQALTGLLFLFQALHGRPAQTEPINLFVVSSQSQAVDVDDEVLPAHAALPGLVKAMSLEAPGLRCRHLDLRGEDVAQDTAKLVREANQPGDAEVAFRKGQRYVPRLEKVAWTQEHKQAVPFERGGVYVISGGLGGIGVEIAHFLLEQYEARLLLLGRSPLPDRTTWDVQLQKKDATAERLKNYLTLEKLGGAVDYAAVDLLNAGQVQQALAGVLEKWKGKLSGVIHLAGHYHDRLLEQENPESLREMLRPKTTGAQVLHRLIEGAPDALFLAFSSAATVFTGARMGAYVAANRYLEAFCHEQRRAGRRSYCFSWTTWDQVGMSRGAQGQELLRARGILGITADQGLHSLEVGLQGLPSTIFVGLDAGNPHVKRFLAGPVESRRHLHAYFTTNHVAVPWDRWKSLKMQDDYGVASGCLFHRIKELPRREDGSVDRQQLVRLGARADRPGTERVAPRTPLETELAGLWQGILSLGEIGVEDNFFELGGHSLLATQLISRIRDRMGIEVPLQALFESPTVAGLARKMEAGGEGQQSRQWPALAPATRDGDLPLSFAQQRLWFLEQLEHGQVQASPYNTAVAFKIEGSLDVGSLEKAFGEIGRRHEALRTAFPSVDGQPRQMIASDCAVVLRQVSLGHLPEAEREGAAVRLINREAQRPFELANGPLWRSVLLAMKPNDHRLVVVLHHIISDGWSLGVLNRELAALYESFKAGECSPLEELPVQYADFAVWQRQWLQPAVLARQVEFWKNELADVPTLLELPTDRPRPPVQSYRGAHVRVLLIKGAVGRSESPEPTGRGDGVHDGDGSFPGLALPVQPAGKIHRQHRGRQSESAGDGAVDRMPDQPAAPACGDGREDDVPRVAGTGEGTGRASLRASGSAVRTASRRDGGGT